MCVDNVLKRPRPDNIGTKWDIIDIVVAVSWGHGSIR